MPLTDVALGFLKCSLWLLLQISSSQKEAEARRYNVTYPRGVWIGFKQGKAVVFTPYRLLATELFIVTLGAAHDMTSCCCFSRLFSAPACTSYFLFHVPPLLNPVWLFLPSFTQSSSGSHLLTIVQKPACPSPSDLICSLPSEH